MVGGRSRADAGEYAGRVNAAAELLTSGAAVADATVCPSCCQATQLSKSGTPSTGAWIAEAGDGRNQSVGLWQLHRMEILVVTDRVISPDQAEQLGRKLIEAATAARKGQPRQQDAQLTVCSGGRGVSLLRKLLAAATYHVTLWNHT